MKKYRFKTRETYKQLMEVDYFKKLSEDERAWLEQFFMEYYQADFNYDKPIHPRSYKKDCEARNNNSKRQLHYLSSEKLEEAVIKAIDRSLGSGRSKSKYYSPLDYSKEDSYPTINEQDQDDNED